MKKLLVALFLCCIQYGVAQNVEVVTSAELPQGIAIINNDIYIGNAFNPTGILRAPVDGTLPSSSSVFVPGIIECNDFAVRGDDLFIGQLDGGYIFRADLTLSTDTAEIVAGPFGSTIGLAFKGDYLYFSTAYPGQIRRLNVLNLSAPSELIFDSSVNIISGIEFIGDDLYFCEGIPSGSVKKINVTVPNPTPEVIVTNTNRPWGIAIDGSTLYISELSNGVIKKIDLSNGNAVYTVLNVEFPRDIDIDGSYLYIAKSNEVVRVELNALSTEEFAPLENIEITPNPSSNVIRLEGLKTTLPYKIFNIAGQLVANGYTQESETINIQKLTSGLYFIEVDTTIFKFIKQ